MFSRGHAIGIDRTSKDTSTLKDRFARIDPETQQTHRIIYPRFKLLKYRGLKTSE
jgi:hypothetical protein